MAALGLCCCEGFSLAVANGAYSLVAMCGLAHCVASLVAEYEHLGMWASVVLRPESAGSTVAAHGLSCSIASGIFPDQGSNSCLLCWQGDSSPLSHPGNHKVA